MMKFLFFNISFSENGKEQNFWPIFINVINGSSFALLDILKEVIMIFLFPQNWSV